MFETTYFNRKNDILVNYCALLLNTIKNIEFN